MENFWRKYKWWIVVAVFFAVARFAVFGALWQASADKGGWNNFYKWAQPAQSVLMVNFHDYCDWHPPLYYAFTSSLLFLFHSQWFIYIIQILLALVSLFLFYKITRLFFSKKVSLIAAFLAGIEPFWAWHNWLLVSENLSVPLFLAGIYFFFKFLRAGARKDIFYSAVLLGFSTLTRPNTLPFTVFISVLSLFLFLLRKKINLEFLPKFNARNVIVSLIVFNAVFFAVLAPWIIRNKIVYGRFALANIVSTNIYFYNLPPLISWQKNISYAEARNIIKKRADKDLGKNVGDQGDCKLFSKGGFNRQLDYYQRESRKYILANFGDYLKMHLFRTLPFFFQSGYFDMYSAYTGEYSKPDITGALLKGDLGGVKKFFSDINFKLIIYLFGILFWGLASLSLLTAFIYSYFKDRSKFIFFFFAAAVICYNALLISPFVLARYRLPVYIFFLAPLVYMFTKLPFLLKLKRWRKS